MIMLTTKKFIVLAATLMICHMALAQSIKIGAIDVFGNRNISSDSILVHLNLKPGDTVTHESLQPDSIVAALKRLPFVRHATVNPVCCDTAKNLLLYIGIGESDSVILKHRKDPTQNVQLPEAVMAAYRQFGEQVEAAVQKGQHTEDHSQGYSLFSYAPARKEQEKFIGFARDQFPQLEAVLKSSRYPVQRAAAAQVIAYSTNRQKVVNALLYAVDDFDETVRNNATRALGILAGYLVQHPELKIKVPAAPFINMLHSITWTDRNKATLVLAQLTRSRDPQLLNQVKTQALPSIIEMAKWKDRGHAFYSFSILGRIAGEKETSLFQNNYSANWPQHVQEMVDKSMQQ